MREGIFMSKRYHINNRGVPALCHAKEGNCPLGKQEGNLREHYSSIEEAQDAVNEMFEEKHGILSVIESSNVGDDEEIERLAKKVISNAKKRGISNDEERAYVEKIKDFTFVAKTTHPERLQSEFGVDTNKFNREIGKILKKNTKLLSEVLSEVNEFEKKYNREMEEYISKDIVKTVEKSAGLTGEVSGEGSIDTGEKGLLSKLATGPKSLFKVMFSGKVKASGERKNTTVETQKLKMNSEYLKRNEEVRESREKLEIDKEKELASLNLKLSEVSRSKKYFNKVFNEQFKKQAELIKNPTNRRQALAYLKEKEELLFKTYISENDLMSIEYKFREAHEEKDEVKMRSCNRIVNMFGANDRSVDTYFDKGVNEGTFNKNYEMLKNGELFSSKSIGELSDEIIDIDTKTYDCFDT